MKLRHLAFALMLATLASMTYASSGQAPTAVEKAVDDFLRRQTLGYPGEVSFSIGPVDSRLKLAACGAIEAFLPAGARLWGNATVGVRCTAPSPWTLYVPVTVRVMSVYLVSATPLAAGRALEARDVLIQAGDLAQMPAGIFTDPAQAIGKTLVHGLATGQPLHQDMLRSPMAVQQGQSVKLVAVRPGLRASSDGRSLSNAAAGQLAQVRVPSGQVISGIARAGAVVEVSF